MLKLAGARFGGRSERESDSDVARSDVKIGFADDAK